MSDDTRLLAIEARISAIEARLNAGSGAPAQTHGAPGQEAIEPLPDHMLSNAWADKVITKDPTQYKGPTMVGRLYSEASSEWHKSHAGLRAWKAKKGKEETPVRVNNNGKPWWESDLFEARLSKAWELRNRGKAPPPASANQDNAAHLGGSHAASDFDDPLPF